MTELVQQQCEVCQVGAKPVSESEATELSLQVPEWNVVIVNNVMQLQREFTFRNFLQALGFTQSIGELAEAEAHHPAILTEWGKVTVTWWTHKIKGLHRNDFVMAAKTDKAFLVYGS